MSDTTQPDTGRPAVQTAGDAGSTANIVYILYLVSLVVGITALVGLVMAYINKGKGPDWVDEHYRFQIRTFWIGLLYAVILGAITAATFGIGGVLFIALLVWWIVRCVKGMRTLGEQKPPANVGSWMFG